MIIDIPRAWAGGTASIIRGSIHITWTARIIDTDIMDMPIILGIRHGITIGQATMGGTIRGIILDGMIIAGTGGTHIIMTATGEAAIGHIAMS